MLDGSFLLETMSRLLGGLPLTLSLAVLSVGAGFLLAVLLTLARRTSAPGRWFAAGYVFAFRGSPLLVQLFLIYYGLSQFPELRRSALWPFLRQPYWCATLALALNTAAYASEIMRGGLDAVPPGAVEAGRALGLRRLQLLRTVTLPLATRLALPAYGNEVVIMVKATALASIVTLMEVTGIAASIVADTFRPFEVFTCAGAIYLAVNAAIAAATAAAERALRVPGLAGDVDPATR